VNKLVLYREVKAEDRLPSKGRYYYTNAGVLRFQLYHGTWHQQPKNSTIGHWLEPIEITEEEIEEILAKGRLYMSVPDVRYKFIAQAILRKLKGE
jgi:hypothetical protein